MHGRADSKLDPNVGGTAYGDVAQSRLQQNHDSLHKLISLSPKSLAHVSAGIDRCCVLQPQESWSVCLFARSLARCLYLVPCLSSPPQQATTYQIGSQAQHRQLIADHPSIVSLSADIRDPRRNSALCDRCRLPPAPSPRHSLFHTRASGGISPKGVPTVAPRHSGPPL